MEREFEILSAIKSPQDLRQIEDVNKLCSEIRQKLVDIASRNGGHLASNLGVVELTVAIHRIFSDFKDKIVWDVGHQSYVHKMLTGRFEKIDTLRKEGGLSGFTNRFENPYDVFTSGHSSVSISAALGLAEAKRIQNENGHVVAVMGDGALTGGLAYEGLNNAGRFKKNFILILNDNKMSISKNVGAVARYLTAARLKPSYRKLKNIAHSVLEKTPMVGHPLKNLMSKSKTVLKNFIYKTSILEDMGFAYYGPVDGHDINKLEEALKLAKEIDGPVVVHVVTSKGKGYRFAEKNPKDFHGVSCFDVSTGESGAKNQTFSDVFGSELCKIAEKEPKICAITASMTTGTGLCEFKSRFKSRFFDVGIAEGHAVTFAGGLAAGGMIPVFAVYSSFLQRSYDQIIHDAALQNFKIILAVDRSGLIGEDGETHQGVFDVSFLNSIPNVTIFAPSYFDELRKMLSRAIFENNKVVAVRYPRGGEGFKLKNFTCTPNMFDLYGNENSETLIITYGRVFSNVCAAQDILSKKGKNVCVMKLNIIKPINPNSVKTAANFKNILFFEESIRSGGVGEKFCANLIQSGFKGNYIIKAVEDEFIKHASVNAQLHKYCLDTDGIVNTINSSYFLTKT